MDSIYIFPVVVLVYALFRLRNVGRRPKGLPPGPPTIPVLGNLHLMPAKQPHHQFKKWAEEYGPIYSLVLGSSTMIVLSSRQAVKDLLDRRSNIYSSRPSLYIGRMISQNERMLTMDYGKKWRTIRSTVHEHLNVRSSMSYTVYQELENRQLLLGILDKPERWNDHLRRYTNSITTQIVFGFRNTDIDDPKMHQLYQGIADFSECFTTPSGQLLDCFPFLQWLPDALLPIRKKAKALNKKEKNLYMSHWLNAKEAAIAGTGNPCMCADLVESQKKEQLSDTTVAYISGSILEAGSDTTWSELVGWVQAMVLFPEVAKQAQQEIDSVCGDRLPTLEDGPNLPYIQACVKETLRWMPTAILGMPHAVIKDDSYMGYHIPQGAAVMLNVWGIHNDEANFHNPRVFDPTRYADHHTSSAESTTVSDPSKRDQYVFGAGRRVCQGMHIAERSMFLAISRLLWAFEFHPIKDESGVRVVLDSTKMTEGILVHPQDVKVKIEVRSEQKAETVRKEWAMMEELLDETGQWQKVPEEMFSKKHASLKV